MCKNTLIPALASTTAALIAVPTQAAFVGFFATVTEVTSGGILLEQIRVVARFNGPTDTVLNAFNLVYQGDATVADPYGAFWHKDNSDYNGGVLSKQYGTWAPTLTGSATLNRPFDSFLVIGGTATTGNTSNADPSWNSGGSGAHAGGAQGWSRADLLNNGTMGWFNSAPPNNQGRVGVSPNTATDVLLGQFVIDRNTSAGTWRLSIGFNDGQAGSAVQFATGTFTATSTATDSARVPAAPLSAARPSQATSRTTQTATIRTPRSIRTPRGIAMRMATASGQR